MNSFLYQALARSQLLRDLQSAFRDATGLSLKLVASSEPHPRNRLGKEENRFCSLISTNPSACEECLGIQQEFWRRFSSKLAPQQICCFAGITELAVPIVVGGEHVATLVGGQVFREKPSRHRLERVIRQLRAWGMQGALKRLERAYVQTPVVSKKQLMEQSGCWQSLRVNSPTLPIAEC
jgi:ligand-binding sensor protein